jgi:hypothetical protein
MIIKDEQSGCFAEYAGPVRVLEEAFGAAGFPIEFALFVSPGGIKYAEVVYPKPPAHYRGEVLNLNNSTSLPEVVGRLANLVRAEGL